MIRIIVGEPYPLQVSRIDGRLESILNPFRFISL
jgi:hypothetical protein